jgi:hypothetical protein
MTTRVKGVSINTIDLCGAISTADMGPQNTDITAQMTAALLAGTPILISAGTWIVSQITLPSGSTIIGFGPRSILKAKDNANVTTVTVGDSCFLSNFAIDGNKNNQSAGGVNGIDFSLANKSKAENVTVTNTQGSGFVVSNNTDGLVLTNCNANNYTESGFKIVSGSDLTLLVPRAVNSDPIATGDGISIISDGSTISNVHLINPVVKTNNGRGIAVIGNGARNVSDITISAPKVSYSNNYNIHILSADTVIINGGFSKNSATDGVRIEGDVINCRFNSMSIKNNAGYGIREVINGATPNYNGFIYNIVASNGNNAVTKVGANSFIA